jgi:hypothetical protein
MKLQNTNDRWRTFKLKFSIDGKYWFVLMELFLFIVKIEKKKLKLFISMAKRNH